MSKRYVPHLNALPYVKYRFPYDRHAKKGADIKGDVYKELCIAVNLEECFCVRTQSYEQHHQREQKRVLHQTCSDSLQSKAQTYYSNPYFVMDIERLEFNNKV